MQGLIKKKVQDSQIYTDATGMYVCRGRGGESSSRVLE
jgi:hypothetical protein